MSKPTINLSELLDYEEVILVVDDDHDGRHIAGLVRLYMTTYFPQKKFTIVKR